MLPTIAIAVAAVAAALVTAWILIRSRYRLPTPADEVHGAPTPDGWVLALYRYRPASPAPGREPVILCHGLLSNRYNVDLDEESSVARYLRRRGFDAWVMELRGHGGSRRSIEDGGGRGRAFDWTLDDYVRIDLPAAIDYVRGVTGAGRVHWFGHSMGGMILYAACALPGMRERIRSAVVSDAPATFGPLRTRTRVARLYGRLVPIVPPALVLPFLGPVTWLLPGILGPRHGIAGRRLTMSILSNAIIPWGSSKVLLQICDMLESGRFRSGDGSIDYDQGAGAIAFPLLVISAARKMMNEEAIRSGFDRAASQDKAYIRFSRAAGYAIDYTHASLLVSATSAEEVFPEIAHWFERHSIS